MFLNTCAYLKAKWIFSRKDMKLIPPDSLSNKEKRQWLFYGFKRNETVLLDTTLSFEENRNMKFQKYIKDYLATVRSVDDNIGRVLNYLKENDLEENTIVIYTSELWSIFAWLQPPGLGFSIDDINRPLASSRF